MPTDPIVPDHIRAAIHAGHVGQVVIFCDRCGIEETADYTGETREIRFAAARQHLADTKGWAITETHDLCPKCNVPDQPDGIEDDSRDLPNPAAAAERVRAYICATGDGLYDVQDGAPLYARDLEALTRAVLHRPATITIDWPNTSAQPAGICGEVGTSFTTGHEPHYTAPCSLPAGHDEPHDWAQREAAGEPSPAETIDALRARIADPGAFLPREHDQDDDGERIYETIPSWSARAVAAGLEDGTLGYIPASRLADVQEELVRTIHTLDLARRELGLTQRDTHHDIAHQLETLASPGMLQMWADTCNPRPTTPEDVLRAVAEKLRRDVTAPVPGSSRRAPEPTFAEGYAEAVARLRDDARYRDWWTSGGVKPDAPIRRHLADYLETVGPDGPDVTTGRWPAREQAVVRAAIAWRKMRAGSQQAIAAPQARALMEAVDALPAAGESQASEPAPTAGGNYVLVTSLVTEDGEQGHPFDVIVTRVDLDADGAPLSLDRLMERVGRDVRRKVATRRPAAPKLATGERPIDLDDRAPRPPAHTDEVALLDQRAESWATAEEEDDDL